MLVEAQQMVPITRLQTVDIQFIPEAVKDYKSLDGNIKLLVNDKGKNRCIA